MTRSLPSVALYGALLTGLLLGGCGKNAPTPASTPAPASTAPAATTSVAPPPAASASAAVPPAAGTVGMAGATSAAPPPAEPFTVAKLTLGSAVNAGHQVVRASDNFATSDKALYASVATEGSTQGATLNAKWSYLEGEGQLVSSISQSIATDGPAITTFKVQNPDLWPEGKYKVEISLDGKPVAKQDFRIGKS